MMPTDLPDHHAFSVRSALEQGVSPERLRTTRVPAPFPGVRSFAAPRRGADLPPEQRHLAHLELCRAYAQRMAPAQFFSHLSAAHLLDAPLPARLRWDEVHVGVRPPDRAPRVAGVVGHRLARLFGDPILIERLSVVSPADMWCQLGPSLDIDELVAVGDHLVRERGASGRWLHQRLPALCSLDDLAAALSGSRHLGAKSLRAALPQIRAGSESPKETELRLAFVRAGLPEPVLNHDLRDRWGGSSHVSTSPIRHTVQRSSTTGASTPPTRVSSRRTSTGSMPSPASDGPTTASSHITCRRAPPSRSTERANASSRQDGARDPVHSPMFGRRSTRSPKHGRMKPHHTRSWCFASSR
ncbi:hypothetical protein [Plantibacter sp. M259]|uniref:hypothetical protein n=1 Tax=Plantibacter sp. M259 TaxID=2583822 RepID=UPI001110D530|nr:hypothetical protein [Plantibacter sp. M259]